MDMQVTAEVHRALKQAPYFGPQGMGVSPAFTGFEVRCLFAFPTCVPSAPCVITLRGEVSLVVTSSRHCALQLVPRNNYPTALCQYRSVTADDPIDQVPARTSTP